MPDLCEHHADVMELNQPTKEQKMGKTTDNEGGIVRCECGRAVPCRHCPTPIDPADIRPGDVVERRDRITVHSLEHGAHPGAPPGFYSEYAGFFPWSIAEGLRKDVTRTWHLVSRPDPDAEAVQAIRSASYNIWRRGERMDPLPGLTESLDLLAKLRERGWDVVRRAES